VTNGNGAPPTVDWWRDPAILSAFGVIAAFVVRILQLNFGVWISAHLGVNLASWTADKITVWATGVPGVLLGGYFLRRRIRSGKDPRNPAPVVTGGATAQTIIGASSKDDAADLVAAAEDVKAADACPDPGAHPPTG
jgi:hypothetical protein